MTVWLVLPEANTAIKDFLDEHATTEYEYNDMICYSISDNALSPLRAMLKLGACPYEERVHAIEIYDNKGCGWIPF